MPIVVRPAPQPINRLVLFACSTAAVGLWLWPTEPGADPLAYVIAGLAGAMSATSFVRAAKLLVQDYQLRRDLAISEEVTTDHGSAREADWDEIVAAGMDNPGGGNFLGLHGGRAPVFAPRGTPFSLIEMPPGAGKTVNYVLGSILHRAKLGYSLVIPDPKLELAVMAGRKLAKMGYEVWFTNRRTASPSGAAMSRSIPTRR